MTIFWIFWLARLPISCHSLLLGTNFIRKSFKHQPPLLEESPGERVTILWIFENGAGVSSCLESSPKRLLVYNEKGQLRFSWVEKQEFRNE